ncbi:hypothetical protein EB796_022207 [Bugula neritina]|uniref:Uncharacterized protein n=1 Tax=Bugula neritina TaxID=10212 RepID=A0A7J7J062_BUGNE|nr:hypothetical protein EB796_022207 [Bugula neritina]
MNMSDSKDSIPTRLAKLKEQTEGRVPASSLNHLFYRNLAWLKEKSSTSSTPGTDLLDNALQGAAGDHGSCNHLDLQQSQRMETLLGLDISWTEELEKLRAVLNEKDNYIHKLESSKETQTIELASMVALNEDLVSQNKIDRLESMVVSERQRADKATQLLSESRDLVIEQSQTIQILKDTVETVENSLCELRNEYNQKEQQRNQQTGMD